MYFNAKRGVSITSMKKPKVQIKDISEYSPALINPNAGTERGVQVIESSIAMGGAGRSMLSDKFGQMIAGSHTLEAFVNAGFTKVIEVETDGTIPVVVRRMDTAIDEPRGMMLQMADNRTTFVNYNEDAAVVGMMLFKLQERDAEEIKGTGYSKGEVDYILNRSIMQDEITPEAPTIQDDAKSEDLTVCPHCGHKWITKT